jgi:hypothetical protein
MRLEHLYGLRFAYQEFWSVGPQNFGLAEGRCEGRVSGRFRGANHSRTGTGGVVLPDFQGFIETDDGAELIFDYRGRGQMHEDEHFDAVGTATHVSGDERYRYLNDVVCALEARQDPGEEELNVDVYELVWEEIAE